MFVDVVPGNCQIAAKKKRLGRLLAAVLGLVTSGIAESFSGVAPALAVCLSVFSVVGKSASLKRLLSYGVTPCSPWFMVGWCTSESVAIPARNGNARLIRVVRLLHAVRFNLFVTSFPSYYAA